MDQPPTDVAESLEPAVSRDDIGAVRYVEANFAAPDATVFDVIVPKYTELEKISASEEAHAMKHLTSMRDMVNQRLGQLQAMKDMMGIANNALKQQENYKRLQNVSNSLQNKLQELQHNDDGPVIKNLLCCYAKQYGYVVTQQSEQAAGTILRVVIQFVIKEKLVSDFPVQIDIATATNKIVAISTEIYPEEKLMKWVNAHEYAIVDVIVKLREILENFMSCVNM